MSAADADRQPHKTFLSLVLYVRSSSFWLFLPHIHMCSKRNMAQLLLRMYYLYAAISQRVTGGASSSSILLFLARKNAVWIFWVWYFFQFLNNDIIKWFA
jgi:hypothetical protein